jgi:hypothetical protein
VPTAPPRTAATATNAIHPNVAVFQCVALQRPARAARLSLMTPSSLLVSTGSRLPVGLFLRREGTRSLGAEAYRSLLPAASPSAVTRTRGPRETVRCGPRGRASSPSRRRRRRVRRRPAC